MNGDRMKIIGTIEIIGEDEEVNEMEEKLRKAIERINKKYSK